MNYHAGFPLRVVSISIIRRRFDSPACLRVPEIFALWGGKKGKKGHRKGARLRVAGARVGGFLFVCFFSLGFSPLGGEKGTLRG